MEIERNYKITEKLITLDIRYSTTRIVSTISPEITFANDYETKVFPDKKDNPRLEGGLRKQGFFKYSYEIENYNTSDETWWACDYTGSRLFKVVPPDAFEFDLDRFKLDNGTILVPLISIVTVVLNSKFGIVDTINSVITQEYPNVEYIVIDGGSTDETIESIKKYEYAIDYWMSEKDQGIYDAMNKGIVLSFGTLLNFMNSNDRFCNQNVLENLIGKIKEELPSHKIFYGNHIIDYSDYKVKKKPGKISNFWKGMQICHQSIFFSTAFHKQNKYEMSLSSDYFLLLRIALSNPNLYHYVELNIAEYKFEGISVKHWLNSRLDTMRYSLQCENNPLNKIFIAIYFVTNILSQLLRNGIKLLTPKGYIEKYRKKKVDIPW